MVTKQKELKALVFAVKKPFATPVQGSQSNLDELFVGASRKYSPRFEHRGPARGISLDDEKNVPAFIKAIGVSTNSSEWDEKVEDYWTEWEYPIKFGEIKNGVADGGNPIDAGYEIREGKIYPNNLEDYILYNLMMNDPDKCAPSEEYWDNKESYTYFIVDLTEQKQRVNEGIKSQAKVTIALAKVLEEGDLEKMQYLIALRGINYTAIEALNLTSEEASLELMKMAAAKGDELLKAVEDTKLNVKVKAKCYIDANIITKSGETYYYNDEPIGKLKDLLLYLELPTNSGNLSRMESQFEKIKLMSIFTPA